MAGQIMTAKDAEQILTSQKNTQGLKTWSQMYADVDLASQIAMSNIKQSFASSVRDAYNTRDINKATIYGSNLGKGYKEQASEELDLAMEEAYNSYLSKYNENLLEIQSGKTEAISQLDKLMLNESENFAKLNNAILPYVQSILGTYTQSDDDKRDLSNFMFTPEQIAANPELAMLYKTDESGNTVPLSDDELHALLFNTDISGKSSLSVKGMQLYDMILNANRQFVDAEGNVIDMTGRTFADYLASIDENEELYNWARSVSPYDTTGGSYKTNLQHFAESMGVGDMKYTNVDKLKYMTDEEFNKSFGNITDVEDTLNYYWPIHDNVFDVDQRSSFIADIRKLNKDNVDNFKFSDTRLQGKFEKEIIPTATAASYANEVFIAYNNNVSNINKATNELSETFNNLISVLKSYDLNININIDDKLSNISQLTKDLQQMQKNLTDNLSVSYSGIYRDYLFSTFADYNEKFNELTNMYNELKKYVETSAVDVKKSLDNVRKDYQSSLK